MQKQKIPFKCCGYCGRKNTTYCAACQKVDAPENWIGRGKKDVYVVDIDGTICTKVDGDNYLAAKPIKEVIDRINALYDAGHHIEYLTARGSTTGKSWYALTKLQLKEWGCKHHKLTMGKQQYDHWIDDKATRPDELVVGYILKYGVVKPGKPHRFRKLTKPTIDVEMAYGKKVLRDWRKK